FSFMEAELGAILFVGLWPPLDHPIHPLYEARLGICRISIFLSRCLLEEPAWMAALVAASGFFARASLVAGLGHFVGGGGARRAAAISFQRSRRQSGSAAAAAAANR